jgi:hypothetical protein
LKSQQIIKTFFNDIKKRNITLIMALTGLPKVNSQVSSAADYLFLCKNLPYCELQRIGNAFLSIKLASFIRIYTEIVINNNSIAVVDISPENLRPNSKTNIAQQNMMKLLYKYPLSLQPIDLSNNLNPDIPLNYTDNLNPIDNTTDNSADNHNPIDNINDNPADNHNPIDNINDNPADNHNINDTPPDNLNINNINYIVNLNDTIRTSTVEQKNKEYANNCSSSRVTSSGQLLEKTIIHTIDDVVFNLNLLKNQLTKYFQERSST